MNILNSEIMMRFAGSLPCERDIPKSIAINIIQHEAITVKAVRPPEIFDLYSTSCSRGRKVLVCLCGVTLNLVDRKGTMRL